MSEIPKIQRVVSILWPSFLVASAATTIFFTAFDPSDLLIDSSREMIYTGGFFSFWGITTSACMLTCYFQRPCLRAGANQVVTSNANNQPSTNQIRKTGSTETSEKIQTGFRNAM